MDDNKTQVANDIETRRTQLLKEIGSSVARRRKLTEGINRLRLERKQLNSRESELANELHLLNQGGESNR